jgi:hypothetical protein
MIGGRSGEGQATSALRPGTFCRADGTITVATAYGIVVLTA